MAKRKIAKEQDIKHLIERASLIKILYDTEIYNLNRIYPGIYEVGFHIRDIAGNEIGNPIFHLKRPKDALPSLVSNLITRTFAEDHPNALNFKEFVGEMVNTLDRPYKYLWDSYTAGSTISYTNRRHQKVNEEYVRLFPLEGLDGKIKHVRLHQGGKKVSYEVPEGSDDWNYLSHEIDDQGKAFTTKWRIKDAAAEMRGYANASADDPWIWSTLNMALYNEMFKTHTKAEHKYRTDLFPVTVGMIAWGPKDEDGIKPGRRFHPGKEREVISLKQADMLVANTRNESAFNERGIAMGNGSDYQPEQAHGTGSDTEGTAALEDLYRRPATMRLYTHFENMGDPAYAKKILMGRAPGEKRDFANQRLRAFARYSGDDGVTSHLGMCIETDERYGNWNQAVMLKLDVDWDAVTYEGTPILDIKDKKKLKAAIRSTVFNKFGKTDSLLELTHLRKTPKVIPADWAIESGAHTQDEYDLALRNRSAMRKNKNFQNAVMEVYEEKVPQLDALMQQQNPLDDELLFNQVGKPKYFMVPKADGKVHCIWQPDQDRHGQFIIRDEQDAVYKHAFEEWQRAKKMDSLLRDLVQPQRLEWIEQDEERIALEAEINEAMRKKNNGEPFEDLSELIERYQNLETKNNPETEREFDKFVTTLKKVRKEIADYNGRENIHHLPRPDYALPPMDFVTPVDTVQPEDKYDLDEDLTDKEDYEDIIAHENLGIDPDEPKYIPSTRLEAIKYIEQLREHAFMCEYENDPSFRFHDYSWRVEVVDKDGHAMPWEEYDQLPKIERAEGWQPDKATGTSRFDVRLQPIKGLTTRRLARMMDEAGDLERMMQEHANEIRDIMEWTQEDGEDYDKVEISQDILERIRVLHRQKELYQARCALMLHGYPNKDPEDHDFLTIRKARKQVHEILQNIKAGMKPAKAGYQAGIDEIGALEALAEHTKDEAEAVLAHYMAKLDEIEAQVPPPTPEQLVMLGIDPLTNDPQPYIRYAINPDNLIPIEFPDDHIISPLSHTQIGGKFVIAQIPEWYTADTFQENLDNGADIEMVGMRSGERRLAAKAVIKPLWDSDQDDYHRDEIQALQNAYSNADIKMPEDRSRFIIIKMEDNPRIAGLRGDEKFVDPNLQAIHVPHTKNRKTFEGIIDAQYGSLPQKISGIVLRSDNIKQPLGKGPVRIREMHGDELTGREIEHSIAKTMELNMAKFIKAYDLLARPSAEIEEMDLEKIRAAGFDNKEELTRYMRTLQNHAKYGYTSAEDFFDETIAKFTTGRHNVMRKPEKYNITVVNFKAETSSKKLRSTMAYFDLYNRPKAAIDSAYQFNANNNAAESAPEQSQKTMRYAGSYVGVAPGFSEPD